MIKLNETKILYQNKEIADLKDIDILENVITLSTEEGILCIPEQDCTEKEKEVFQKWRELYPEGKPKPIVETKPTVEEADPIRVMVLENMLEMADTIEGLKQQIEALKK